MSLNSDRNSRLRVGKFSEFDIRMAEEDLKRFVGSKHIGIAGEKMEFMGLKVFMREEKEGDYGITTILGFEDREGNVVIWFAAGPKRYQTGDAVSLRATIKGFDESGGVRKTIIVRAKEIENKKIWSARTIIVRKR